MNAVFALYEGHQRDRISPTVRITNQREPPFVVIEISHAAATPALIERTGEREHGDQAADNAVTYYLTPGTARAIASAIMGAAAEIARLHG